jgi:hypothetical protein
MEKQMAKKEYKETYVLEGTVNWAKVHAPDENDKFSLEFEPDKEGIKLLKSLGIDIMTEKTRTDKETGKETTTTVPAFVKMKRYAKDPEGNLKKFRIIDADLEPVTALIGNGSRCKVEFFAKDWTFKAKSGTYAYLVGLQVIDLVQYTPKNTGKFTKEAGSVKAEADDEPAEEENKFTKKAKR